MCKRQQQHTFYAKDRINQRNGSSKIPTMMMHKKDINNNNNNNDNTSINNNNNTIINLVGCSDQEDESEDYNFIKDEEENNNPKDDSLVIVISQFSDSNDYALYIWDCSIVLSFFIWCQDYNEFWLNKVTLELGSGVSLPSILLSKLHKLNHNNNNNNSNFKITDFVIITDRNDESFSQIKNNIINSCYLNDLNETNDLPLILPFSYGDNNLNDNEVIKIDYLLVSDCFYDNTIDYDDISSTFYYFFQLNNNLKIFITYQIRCTEKSISSYLIKWGIKATLIENQTFLPSRITESLKSEIFLYQLELQHQKS